MNNVFDFIESGLKNLGFQILEKKSDGYYHVMSIEKGKKTFVVYTTEAIITCYKDTAFKMMQLKKPVPFKTVSSSETTFLSNYIRKASVNNIEGIYSSGYSDLGILDCLRTA